jgi:hypothetical protein
MGRIYELTDVSQGMERFGKLGVERDPTVLSEHSPDLTLTVSAGDLYALSQAPNAGNYRLHPLQTRNRVVQPLGKKLSGGVVESRAFRSLFQGCQEHEHLLKMASDVLAISTAGIITFLHCHSQSRWMLPESPSGCPPNEFGKQK